MAAFSAQAFSIGGFSASSFSMDGAATGGGGGGTFGSGGISTGGGGGISRREDWQRDYVSDKNKARSIDKSRRLNDERDLNEMAEIYLMWKTLQ